MNEPVLSERELRILGEIERDLGTDARLDRALRTMHRGLPSWFVRPTEALIRMPDVVLAVLLALSAALLPAVTRTLSAVALGLFAAVWAPTVIVAAARALRQRRRHPGPRSPKGPDRWGPRRL